MRKATHNDWAAWTDSTKLPDTAKNYYLDTDVTMSSTWTVPSGTTNLCLNGHNIKITGDNNAIFIGGNVTLNITDCNTTVTHKYKIVNGVAVVNDYYDADYKTFTGGYIQEARKEEILLHQSKDIHL